VASGSRFYNPYANVLGPTGAPVPGALLNFYVSGSSTVRATTYADVGLTTPNSNPVVADATGTFPAIFLDPAVTYRVICTYPPVGILSPVQIYFADPVTGAAGSSTNTTPPSLFSGIAASALPSSIVSFTTSGYSTPGLGGGSYVSDLLATSSLVSTCPLFCVEDSLGRYWRLAGPVIYVEQGGATGVAGANDQVPIQGALAYAAAVGIRGVSCQREAYTLWATVRTTTPNYTMAPDGHYLVVTADVHFSGCSAGTTFTLLNSTGGPYSTVTQTISGTAWYGGAIFPWPNGTGSGTINQLRLTNITMTGGVGYTLSGTVPAGNTGPGQTGSNLFGKGYWAQGVAIGNTYFTDCEFWGFYGEVCYLAMSNATANVFVNRMKLHDSPQSTWNPSGFNIRAIGLECYNNNGVEILGGQGHSYAEAKFHDMNTMSVTGGPANGLGFNYAYPTRVSTVAPPWVDFFDCDWQNVTQLILGTWVRVHKGCTATDTMLYLQQATTGGCGACFDMYIDLDYTIDQAGQNPICEFQGPPTLTTLINAATGSNYILPPQNCHIRMDVHRTAYAIANSRFAVGLNINGYIDQTTCSVEFGMTDGLLIFGAPSSEFSLPLMIMDTPASMPNYTQGANQSAMTSGPYALKVISPRHTLQNTGTAAAIAITIQAPYSNPYGYANGQRCRIWWDPASTASTTYTFATSGAGLAINSACTLSKHGHWLELEFNTISGLWHEVSRNTY
jgi:hypothetical protein